MESFSPACVAEDCCLLSPCAAPDDDDDAPLPALLPPSHDANSPKPDDFSADLSLVSTTTSSGLNKSMEKSGASRVSDDDLLRSCWATRRLTKPKSRSAQL